MNAMTRRHPVVLFVYYVMTLVLLIVAGHPLLYGLLLLLMGIDVSLNRGFLKMLKSFVGSLTVAALCEFYSSCHFVLYWLVSMSFCSISMQIYDVLFYN